MKILEVTGFPNNGAGSGTLMTSQTVAFLKDGHDVHTILSENRTDFPRVEGSDYRLVAFTADTENHEVIDNQLPFNFPMFTTHTRSTETFWNVRLDEINDIENKYREAIAEEIKTFSPDVIHAQHNWIHAAVCTEFNVPVVVTIHGTDLMGYERILREIPEITEKLNDPSLSDNEKEELNSTLKKYEHYKARAEKSARDAAAIIVISEDQKNKFNTLFPNCEEKVNFIKNGYNTDNYHLLENIDKEDFFSTLTSATREDKKVPTDYDKLVTFVGKFADFKGIDVLLDSAKIYENQMQAKGQKVMTVIVGSGALDTQLKQQAKDLGLKNVHFVGLQTPDVICKLQNLSDISLVPSRNEPFGLVVIEGLACGHPVIATNGGGIPDIMNTTRKIIKKEYTAEDKSNENILAPDTGTKGTYTTDLGIIVPIDDSNSLAQAVVDVLTGNKVFDNDKIVEYVKNNYSQEKINKDIANLFSKCIANFNS